MKLRQYEWGGGAGGWRETPPPGAADADLVLIFGPGDALRDGALLRAVQAAWPRALLAGCSTAGGILGNHILDATAAVTAVRLEASQVRGARVDLAVQADSREAGRRLAHDLAGPGLAHVFVLSDGLRVNGSELVAGLSEALPAGVAVTGGLSADGTRFQHTLVLDGATAREGVVAAVGFYGDRLRVGCGSLGGWDPFGPDRLITRSIGNVLYELDGQPALELYRRYLGDYARNLPASGLLFPLLLRPDEDAAGVVRTILSIDAAAGSLTFAGDMPQGALARLMKASSDRLIDGALGAARLAQGGMGGSPAELALLISCVGRRLVLKQRAEEEVEAVGQALGAAAVRTGFYSYGEICPLGPGAPGGLHNQTMTITTLRED